MKINKSKMYDALVKLCWLVVISCWVLKLFGYKEFEIPYIPSDPSLLVKILINGPLYCLNGYCFALILVKRKLKVKEILFVLAIDIPLYFMSNFSFLNVIQMILEFIAYPIIGIILTKDKPYKQIIEGVVVSVMFIAYQAITMLYKGIPIAIKPVGFVPDKVLQIDYYVLVILTVLDTLKKGEYIYYGWWQKFLVLLSKLRRNKKCVQQSKEIIHQKVDEEIGFKLFIVFLSIFQITIVGVSCYFINGVILEYIIIALSFFILKKVFGNCYHADTVIKCTTLSIAIFVTATRLSLPLWMSVFCNVLIGCLVAYIMYVMYYFIKFTTTTGITIHKGMSLEDLNSLCDLYNVNEIDKTILVEYYVNRKRLDTIAYKLNYSIEAVKKRKANILKKLQKPID